MFEPMFFSDFRDSGPTGPIPSESKSLHVLTSVLSESLGILAPIYQKKDVKR